MFVMLSRTACWLNPTFQYKGDSLVKPEHVAAVREVFETLDPNSEGLPVFGNEVGIIRYDYSSLYYILLRMISFTSTICADSCFSRRSKIVRVPKRHCFKNKNASR